MQTTDPSYSRQLIDPQAASPIPLTYYRRRDILMSIASEHITMSDGDLVYNEVVIQTEN